MTIASKGWRTCSARQVFVGSVASLALASSCHAATCPADLSNLIGQVQTVALQPMLTESIDDRVTREGGLAAAIANAQARLDRLTLFKSQMKDADDDATKLSVDESIVIVTSRIQALTCRRTTAP